MTKQDSFLFFPSTCFVAAVPAGVPMDVLKEVGYAITRLPDSFTPHRQIRRVYDARRQMVETMEGVDWGMAEALAFGTLISEGAGATWLANAWFLARVSASTACFNAFARNWDSIGQET
jgi:hypothetical protein